LGGYLLFIFGSTSEGGSVIEPTFIPANPIDHRDALISLNVEYMSWLAAEGESYFDISTQDALGMTIAEYVPTVL